ncbi:hypothetical protein LA303_10185 [Candidatus Sulfidibacterium hydrothermale]|uniref:hypothetical protein n=1 Tax=Candidatus Sulfidibacterium hydrothermale TaxID=2875962 RepID=UPI001F0A8586|nr:hypothetical protein [Candidatus Sulfidibacterium hydrothermale]UBM61772.1 hypothetical protein LA303_10185 [Candidatus Sulfidibacterium hydrothermale]
MLFQVLSLDVTGGALASGCFWAHLFGVPVRPVWLLVLALSVWTVYTADHLVDGMTRKQAAVIYRHRFHYQYRRFFIVTLVVIALLAAVLAWIYLGAAVFENGMWLGTFAAVYLLLVLLVRKSGFYFHKEFFIALFYVAGTALAPVTWHHRALMAPEWILLVIYVLTAWSESVLMSFYEQNEDQQDHLKSFTTFYGHFFTRRFVAVLLVFLIFLLIGLVFVFPHWRIYFSLLLVMNLLLSVLLLFPSFFQVKNRYRWWGEWVFWPPFVLLL